MDAGQCRQASKRLRRRDLFETSRRQYARALVDADAACAVRVSRYAQRVDLDCGLFHDTELAWTGELSADLPLRLSSVRRRGSVAARTLRPRRCGAARQPYSDR